MYSSSPRKCAKLRVRSRAVEFVSSFSNALQFFSLIASWIGGMLRHELDITEVSLIDMVHESIRNEVKRGVERVRVRCLLTPKIPRRFISEANSSHLVKLVEEARGGSIVAHFVTYSGRPEPAGAPGEIVLGGCAHRVADGLFLGSREVAERPLEELRALSIGAVVNCAPDVVPCAHLASLEYGCVGVRDSDGEDILSFLGVASDWVRARRSGGVGVLVHCEVGVSRSATVAIAALMAAEERAGRDGAYARVKGKRPVADPNMGFWRQLAQFGGARRARRRAGRRGRRARDRRGVGAPRARARAFSPRSAAEAFRKMSADAVRAGVCAGVDCWLGRGADERTGEWLESIALDGDADGARAGLHATLLSPEYMDAWACELRERELSAIMGIARRRGRGRQARAAFGPARRRVRGGRGRDVGGMEERRGEDRAQIL